MIKEMLTSKGAVVEGHFKLASGLHGAKYLSCANILSEPKYADRIIKEIAQSFVSERIHYVVGINEAGAILAHGVARELGVRFALVRIAGKDFAFARGFTIEEGSSVLIVDDVTTTGGTVYKLIDLCKQSRASVIGVGLVATKGLSKLEVECPVVILAQLDDFNAWTPETCPMCANGVPLSA